MKRFALLIAVLLVGCNDPAQDPTGPKPAGPAAYPVFPFLGYTTSQVGLMTGGTFSTAAAINTAGTIVGQADHCSTFFFNGHPIQFCSTTAYYKPSGGAMTAIPLLPGHVTSTATGVTDAGLVVGWSRPSGGFPIQAGWIYNPATHHLDSLPRINGGGVVFSAAAPNGWTTGTRYNGATLVPVAFRYSVVTNYLEDLLPAGYAGSQGLAIDAAGDVAGYVYTTTEGVNHGFVWYGGGPNQDLASLNSGVSVATGISGTVVGPFKPYDGVTPRVYSYTIGGSLGDIGAGINRYPTGLSDKGRLIGYGTTTTHTPFTFHNTVSVTLPGLTGLSLFTPTAVNRCGTIVGTGYDAGYRYHAVVWSQTVCD